MQLDFFCKLVIRIATVRVLPVHEKYATSILGVPSELVMFKSSCIFVSVTVDVFVPVSVLAELQADERRKIIMSKKLKLVLIIIISP